METQLVSILVASKDRQGELNLTLQEISRQHYPAVELIVVDDGSTPPLRLNVDLAWAAKRLVRHEQSSGQSRRRNEGFGLAKGRYILHLDDDCALTDPDDLARMVAVAESDERIAAVVPNVYNGSEPPAPSTGSLEGRACAISYVGACVLLRKSAIAKTAGYRSFFRNDREEEELSLQLISKGYRLVYVPGVTAHHRLSVLNRNSVRSWRRGFRNQFWLIFLHLPWRRIPLEVGWKMALGAWDAVRLVRPGRFFLESPKRFGACLMC